MQSIPDEVSPPPTLLWRIFYALSSHLQTLAGLMAIGMWVILYVCLGLFMGEVAAMLIALFIVFGACGVVTYVIASSEPILETPESTF